MKRCSVCRQDKPENDFYRNKGWRDGFHPYCKSCLLSYQKRRYDETRGRRATNYRWKRDLVRHDYFSALNSLTSAYLLGFLAADGNVLPAYGRITVEIAARDESLLRLMRDELVPGGAITSRTRRGREYRVLAFVSRQMVEDLARYGVEERKSLTLRWPEILSEEYVRPFLLGYFDGDGFITVDRTRYRGRTYVYPLWGVTCGSWSFLSACADACERHTGFRPGGPWQKDSSGAAVIRASGVAAQAIDQWLHQEDGLGLPRKRLDTLGFEMDWSSRSLFRSPNA